MNRNVFDHVACDYERIHDRSLPPGVHSADFIRQRVASVTRWILESYAGQEFCYLDFGCGNGRMLKSLFAARALRPLVVSGRLRLFGLDTSVESLKAARSQACDDPVCLVSDWKELPGGLRFDLVTSCHVFHHIPVGQRAAVVQILSAWMKPASRLVVWEHNPFNPITRLLVRMCPFDGDADLLTLNTTRRVFGNKRWRHVRWAYVNVFPPRWLRSKALAAMEQALLTMPVGAQYWAMFEREG